MHLAAAVTDADLLTRYLRDGDEMAFATLVQLHERMVIGTAWRHTGDAQVARDVAQEVFATLARKAVLLAGRTSLAGWLHIAARHLASRTRSAEAARRTRVEGAMALPNERQNEETGVILEEALAALGTTDREALVLHYFEDRSYAEMAATLGLQEAAVRKRVSRGLERLGTELRKRGYRSSPVAALVTAGAFQAGLPGIVTAGVAMPAAAAGSTPLALTLTTLMGNTATKLAATLVVTASIPIVWLSHGNSATRAELAEIRRTTPSHVIGEAAPGAGASHAEIAALADRLAEMRRRKQELSTQLTDGWREIQKIEQEVVVKFGKTEDLARTFAAKLEEIAPVIQQLAKKEPLDTSGRLKVARAMKVMAELLPYLGQLRQMDEQPEHAARFAATLSGEVLKLPQETIIAVEQTISEGYAGLKRDGLTLSNRPKRDAEAWMERRNAADKALTSRVLSLLPDYARKHPILQFMGRDTGILLPSAAAVLGSVPESSAQDGFLKAMPIIPETPREENQR